MHELMLSCVLVEITPTQQTHKIHKYTLNKCYILFSDLVYVFVMSERKYNMYVF